MDSIEQQGWTHLPAGSEQRQSYLGEVLAQAVVYAIAESKVRPRFLARVPAETAVDTTHPKKTEPISVGTVERGDTRSGLARDA